MLLSLKANWRTISRLEFKPVGTLIEMCTPEVQKIHNRFQEIDQSVVSVKEKLINYEREYYGKVLVALIEEKNRVLQSRINDAIAELNALQRLNEPEADVPTSGVLKCDAGKRVETSGQQPANQPTVQEAVVKKNEKSKQDASSKGGSEKPKESKKSGAAPSAEGPVDVGRLDMRVGRIVEIKKHPDADSLYVEQVDIGKPNPITVVSGLVKHVPIEEMQNRLVVILCNLKPAKMRGVLSEGMVMCASTPDKVEVLRPPPSAEPGDVIRVPGYEKSDPDAVLNPKKKIFETVAPDLKTDQDLCASYLGIKWSVAGKGPVTADTLKNVNIK